MNKKIFFMLFSIVAASSIFASGKEGNKLVDISVKTENISDTDAVWLVPAISEKLESNLSKYTDFHFINSANRNDVFQIQKESESVVFDEADAIEIGKLKHADYQAFATVRKVNDKYTLSVKFTDLTTLVNIVPVVISTPRISVQNLCYDSGCAVDEITISVCKALGNELSLVEQSYLMHGDVSLSRDEKQKLYYEDIKNYNKRIEELDKEIKNIKYSTDIYKSVEEERLKASKILAEEKLKLLKESQKRLENELKLQKEDERKNEIRTQQQMDSMVKLSGELERKVKNIRNKNFESQSLLGQINVIELKKSAAIDIQKSINREVKSTLDSVFRLINDKKRSVMNRPYMPAELKSDGKTPSDIAIAQRNKLFQRAKDKIVAEKQNDINLVTKRLEEQKKSIINEINNDYSLLKPRKISTLGNELIVSYGPYDGDKMGWILNVAVKNDNTILFQTASFLSFEDLTGKDPYAYMDEDYMGYLYEVDFYDSLLLSGDPLLIYELEYSAKPLSLDNPSSYDFSFYDFKCYDTKTLSVDGGRLSSSKVSNLKLDKNYITRKMTPSYDLRNAINPSLSLNDLVEDRIKKERLDEIMEKAGLVRGLKYAKYGESGSLGSDATYFYFGNWPQTIKDKNVTIDTKNKEDVNGWTCYWGSDNCLYVEEKISDKCKHNFEGEGKPNKDKYYFKMEPIKWGALKTFYGEGRRLLLSESILSVTTYINDENDPRYKNGYAFVDYGVSNLRTWLNEEFFYKAFTKENYEKILVKEIDNMSYSEGRCENTYDKVFVLSLDDTNNEEYFGFMQGLALRKQRKVTDYSLAKGLRHDYKSGFETHKDGFGPWFIRSPGVTKSNGQFIFCNGQIYDFYIPYYKSYGVVPAIEVEY